MSETWSFFDQGILGNKVSNPPTYDDYLMLCWEFIDRQAKAHSKDLLLGRSNTATPVTAAHKPNAPATDTATRNNRNTATPVAAVAPSPHKGNRRAI